MARALSKDKRTAILEAAAHWVAADGLAARSAKIAQAASVADGTVFKYFPTKDALLNALYVWLKQDLVDAVMAAFQARDDRPGRWEAVWSAYVDWGVAHADKRRALKQLRVSETITAESRNATLPAMTTMAGALFEGAGADPAHATSPDFTSAVFEALAEMTIDRIEADRGAHPAHRRRGFEAFWRAIGGA
ncbi:TetR/AcrR family transcriptional regulator [Segnochrobactrum spirostomi]|uniref:TetR/AcrR family transcriptional regulator n=1 Tax=Segnochrobactrum spirostomi TaxID=2608987 RepID=UPI001AD7EA86|nr:TetR/AcrR family transcriptional regulator [Segnochrobactrum spirostomi]